MRQNLPLALDKIFIVEGGYVDDPNDNGGATNMGITIGTLSKWRNYQVSKDEVKSLTRKEATEIYKSWYWDPVKADDLPSGVDVVVFDMAVNAGPSRAAKILQQTIGVTVDGKIGPKTIAAVKAMDPVEVVKAYTTARLDFYRSLGDWKHFGRGWTNRARKVEEVALGVLSGQVAPTLPENKPAIETALQSLLQAILNWLMKNLKNGK
jgi:lysozyme family protein